MHSSPVTLIRPSWASPTTDTYPLVKHDNRLEVEKYVPYTAPLRHVLGLAQSKPLSSVHRNAAKPGKIHSPCLVGRGCVFCTLHHSTSSLHKSKPPDQTATTSNNRHNKQHPHPDFHHFTDGSTCDGTSHDIVSVVVMSKDKVFSEQYVPAGRIPPLGVTLAKALR